MKKQQHYMQTVIAIGLLFLCSIFFMVVSAHTLDYEEQYQRTLDYEKNYVSKQGLDDWGVFTLSRADALTEQQKQDYLKDLKELLEESQGVLSRNRSTEYSRRVLAVTALGIDANDVYGYSLLEPLACYDFTVQQGIYGGIYALLAVDCGKYEMPLVMEGYQQTTRDNLISYLLQRQLADGGWAVSGKYSNPDATAAVVAALTPYYNRPEVRQALDKGVNKLSGMMGSMGAYTSYGDANAESTAQVLVAMAAFGISLEHEGYVKEEHTILDGLFSFQLADGSFEHTKGSGFSQMATEQALYAMVALKRQQEGRPALYQMIDAKKDTSASRDKQNINLDGLWSEFKEEEQLPPKQDENMEEEQLSSKQDKEGGSDGMLSMPDSSSVIECQTELARELLKTPAGWELARKESSSLKGNKAQKKRDSSNSRKTITLDIKPLLKPSSHFSNQQQARKTSGKKTRKRNVRKKALVLFPSKKQEEIDLLVEQGVSFTVKKKGFSSPYLLEQKVTLKDGDYVLCRYVDASTKPEALAKVWVKKGMLSVTIEEAGHYFVGKKVKNCSVSELRVLQSETTDNGEQKEGMMDVQKQESVRKKVSGETVDIMEPSNVKKRSYSVKKIGQHRWIALGFLAVLMIGWGWICRFGKRK